MSRDLRPDLPPRCGRLWLELATVGIKLGKDRGKTGESSIQSVFPGYDMYEGIISAHFQDWSGETCIIELVSHRLCSERPARHFHSSIWVFDRPVLLDIY